MQVMSASCAVLWENSVMGHGMLRVLALRSRHRKPSHGSALFAEPFNTSVVEVQVLQPAIELAEEGFPVAPVTAYHWAATSMELRGPGKAAFLNPEGDPPGAGEIQRNPDLGRTFRSVAERGAPEGGVFISHVLMSKAARLLSITEVDLLQACHVPLGGSGGQSNPAPDRFVATRPV